MRKYGIENFKFKILLKNIPIEQLDYYERLWIKKLNTLVPNGYNLSSGGGVLRGEENPMYGKPSPFKGIKNPEVSDKMKLFWKEHPERREEYSKRMSGKNNPMYGKHLSEESKKKISEKMKGENNYFYGVHFYGDENPFWGHHHTQETKEKISNAHNKDKKPIAQYNKDTGEYIQTFDCIQDAERWLRNNGYPKADGGACSKVARGKQNYAYNFIWKFIEKCID